MLWVGGGWSLINNQTDVNGDDDVVGGKGERKSDLHSANCEGGKRLLSRSVFGVFQHLKGRRVT